MNKQNTFTLKIGKTCEHSNIVYKRAVVNLWLIRLEMTYEICTNCGDMKAKNKYWRIN